MKIKRTDEGFEFVLDVGSTARLDDILPTVLILLLEFGERGVVSSAAGDELARLAPDEERPGWYRVTQADGVTLVDVKGSIHI